MSEEVLARCAGCGHNIEVKRLGRITCPICKAEIWVGPAGEDAISGEPMLGEKAAPAQQGAAGREQAEREQAEQAGQDRAGQEQAGQEQAGQEQAGQERTGQERTGQSGDEPDERSEHGPTDADLHDIRTLLAAAEQMHRHRIQASMAPAWESDEGGRLRRFARTAGQVYSNASGFFSALQVEHYSRAMSFGWILCTLAVLCFALNGLWQIDQHSAQLLAESADAAGTQRLLDSLHSALLVLLVGAPLFGLVNLWFTAALYHLGVLLVAGEHRGFRATFRATAYGFVPLLLFAIPIVGHLIGGLWSLVIQVIAVGQVHRIGPARAALAVLMPVTALMLLTMLLS
ncbi:MAG: YIP1 family protein [Deltaproteobacteria bacterium]|nr:YIP1 family protein [Deltaproteobacteria bacterium]